ncbi:hypothetical protein BGZ46_006590 [Entomortierella lignicola]|nr:hypothetical protein BGZ46_006590 [Entomortierella lignicola]
MPALLCSETTFEVTTYPRKQLLLNQFKQPCDIFAFPEICDLIAQFLDKHSLTVVVRISSAWYASWIRHIWRWARVESGTGRNLDMMQAFPRLSQHIRQLEWIHLSDSAISANSIIQSVDMSALNLQSLLLSNWSNSLESTALESMVKTSADRISVLQLYNMSGIQGDILKVAGSLSKLRHFSLCMADQGSLHGRNRRRSSGSISTTSTTSTTELQLATPNSHSIIQDKVTSELEYTSADSLPDLLNSCPQLRTIELRELPAVSATPKKMLYEADEDTNKENIPQQLQPMQHLTIINLYGTAISGSTLSILFNRCPQLTKLNLGQISPLYISGFHLERTVSMDILSSLVLSRCHFLDGHGFKEIFKASPNLVTLDIPQTNIDDSALGVLGHQCCHLRDLNLDGCQQITDQGIQEMLSHRPIAKDNTDSCVPAAQQGPYRNYNLHCLSVSDCTALTGQGIRHILMTCARLNSLEAQQPELHPESLFPPALESDDSDTETASTSDTTSDQSNELTTLYPGDEHEPQTSENDTDTPTLAWACNSTLEILRIKNLNFLNKEQARFLNSRLRELSQLKVLHIGGSQLELSILNGLGHQIENLFIDDLAREVDLNDVRWLVDHTPNLTRLWCRQLIRHSEPWKILRAARKHLKLW